MSASNNGYFSALLSFRPLHFLAGDRAAVYTTLQALPYFLLSIQSWIYLPVGENSLIYTIAGSGSLTWSISTEWFFLFALPMHCLACSLCATTVDHCRVCVRVVRNLDFIFVLPLQSRSAYQRVGYRAFWPDRRHAAALPGFIIHSSAGCSISRPISAGRICFRGGCRAALCSIAGYQGHGPRKQLWDWFFCGRSRQRLSRTYLGHSENIGENIFHEMILNFALGPSAAVLIFCAARYRNVAKQLLMSRPALLLGDASYSIYLLHFNALVLVAWLTESAAHNVAFDAITLVAAMLIILLSSIVLYRYFELPARNWLGKLGGRPRRARCSRGSRPTVRGGRAEIYADLRQVGSRPVCLKIGDLLFQHFNFVTTTISVIARVLRVDFQSSQKLPEPGEIGICRSFDHARS